MTFWIYLEEIWRGKDLYRILMNLECRQFTLAGKVLDLGAGREQASYHRFFKKDPAAQIQPLDQGLDGIDLEKDRLPQSDSTVNQILAFNLLEHIFNYNYVLAEALRVLKPGGQIIGAVPFLVGFHPDPYDYFRFTSEALEKILSQAGFGEIKTKIFGRGPFSVAYSQLEFILPRILKIFILPIYYFFDWLLNFFLKAPPEHFALGLFFSAKKS